MFSVPSSVINVRSIKYWLSTFLFTKAGAIILLILFTAFLTLLPSKSPSLSLSSSASNLPVEAPDGTEAMPFSPENNLTSTSIVGLPRESRI